MMTTETPDALIARLAAAAREAAAALAHAPADRKQAALTFAAQAIRDAKGAIMAANAEDLAYADGKGLSPAMVDRLRLDAGRLALEEIRAREISHVDNESLKVTD